MYLDLQNLRRKTHRHPLSPIFKKYAAARIARELDVTVVYFQNIMSGCRNSSKKMEQKLQDLAERIQAAEQAEAQKADAAKADAAKAEAAKAGK